MPCQCAAHPILSWKQSALCCVMASCDKSCPYFSPQWILASACWSSETAGATRYASQQSLLVAYAARHVPPTRNSVIFDSSDPKVKQFQPNHVSTCVRFLSFQPCFLPKFWQQYIWSKLCYSCVSRPLTVTSFFSGAFRLFSFPFSSPLCQSHRSPTLATAGNLDSLFISGGSKSITFFPSKIRCAIMMILPSIATLPPRIFKWPLSWQLVFSPPIQTAGVLPYQLHNPN